MLQNVTAKKLPKLSNWFESINACFTERKIKVLTEKEYKSAYKTVKDVFYVTFCPDEAEKKNIQCPSFDDFVKSIDVLEKLVNEHFKSKKTLNERMNGYKGEIPKDNPWGDRYADECSKEEINKWILEGYGMPPIREKDDVD